MQSSVAFVFRDDSSFKCKRLRFQQVSDFERASEETWRECSDAFMKERYQLMKDLADEAVYSTFNDSCGPMIALMDPCVADIARHERFLDVWKRMAKLASPAHFAGVSSKVEVDKNQQDTIIVHVLIHFHRPPPCLFQRQYVFVRVCVCVFCITLTHSLQSRKHTLECTGTNIHAPSRNRVRYM